MNGVKISYRRKIRLLRHAGNFYNFNFIVFSCYFMTGSSLFGRSGYSSRSSNRKESLFVLAAFLSRRKCKLEFMQQVTLKNES